MFTLAIYTFYNHFLHLIYLCDMISGVHIPAPVMFNPLKHHLGFIREYTRAWSDSTHNHTDQSVMISELKHLGSSVMDIYSGTLTIEQICREVLAYPGINQFAEPEKLAAQAGRKLTDFRIITLSDSSRWSVSCSDSSRLWVHIFPARGSIYSFRIKSNTIRSAILYHILIGKDYVTNNDLNIVRSLLGLSPVKDTVDAEAINEMIEILRVDE
jgi:hypothetical protein